jgi:hypothetical protein
MPIYGIAKQTGVSIPTTTETAVVTMPVAVGAGTALGTLIRGWIQLLAGTAATAITIRCRQGAINGTIVDTPSPAPTVTAGATGLWPFSFWDQTEYPQTPGAQYLITVQQTSATGNGTAACEATVEDQ